MRKPTSIIPFPRRNDRKYFRNRLERPTPANDGLREKQTTKGDPASIVIGPAGNELPQIQEFYGLMNEQCNVLVNAMQALVEHVEDCSEETAGKLQAIARRSAALKERDLCVLERLSTTAMNISKVFRAIVTLDMAIDCAKTTTGHILDLGIRADRFMLDMAVQNKVCAQALQRGFCKLATNPLQAEEDARAVRKAKRNTDEIYRSALAELADNDEMFKMWKADRERLKTMSNLCGMLGRREIYRNLSKSAKRFAWAANRLREIIPQTASPYRSTKEPIG